MGMGLVLPLILQLVKFCMIGFAVTVQGSKGFVVSPSPAFLPAIHPSGETPGPVHHGESWGSSAPSSQSGPDGFVISPSPPTLPVDPSPSEAPGILPPRDLWRTIAPSSPEVPNGPFLLPPVTLPPPISAPTPQRIKGIEPSISPTPSPSTITLSPPYKPVLAPSTAQGNLPPSTQPSPPRKAPAVRPPVSTPTAPAPVAIPSGNLPKTSPVSEPSPRTRTLLPPYKAVPAPSTAQRNVPPSVQPSPPQRKAPDVRPSVSTPIAPAPVAIPSGNLPKSSPVSQPSPRTITLSPPYKAVPAPTTTEGNAPPYVQPIPTQRKAPAIMPPVSTPTAPAPVAIPSGNLPKSSPVSQPSPRTITLSPPYKAVPAPSTAEGNVPPSVQPSPPQRKAPDVRPPVSTPTTPAPVAIPSGNLPKSSPVSQPSPRTITLSPPYKAVPAPTTAEGNAPPYVQPIPTQRKAPVVMPPVSTPTAPAPVAIPSGNLPKSSPVSQPSPRTITLSPPYKAVPAPTTAEGNAPPYVQPIPTQRKAPVVMPPVSTPTTPAPVAIPSGNLPKSSPVSQPSPRTIILSPPYKAVPEPTTTEGNAPPYVQPIPTQRKAPVVMPPVSTPTAPAPVAIPFGNLPKISPVSQPSPRTITLSPLYKVVPAPSIAQGSVPPSAQPSPPQRKAPAVRPPVSTPIAPAPVAIHSGNLPKTSPVSQPIERGSLPPKVDERNASNSHTPEPVSPAPVAIPSTNLPKISPVSQPTKKGSLPPNVHREGANKGHTPEPISPAPIAVSLPQHSPVSQPSEHGNLPSTVHRRNSSTGHSLEPVSQAPVAIPPAILPENSPVSQPTHDGSFPPNVHKGTTNEGHTHTPEPTPPQSIASPPWKMENNQPIGHPIFPKISPSILPAPVTSPTSAFPVNPPSVHPVIPAGSPSKLPAPVVSPALTPSRSFNWKKGEEPVSAPLYKTPKPLPAIVHSPAQAPAEHKSRQFHHAPEPLISSPKSHSPASSPSTTFDKHHHTRSIITSPAPASSYLVSPPTSKHQDQPIPPSLLPTSGRRHHAPPPTNTDSSVSPFAFPVLSPVSLVSPAPAPSFKISPHPTKISPSRSSSKSPKTPDLPQIQALPPPPPNEDCLSTVCSEPYTNSPPGAPCRCVWPMKVGLRLSVSLYTFFPLVSELASEIATGVFMRQSQVRIMGANAASQQPDKTIALIDLVPLGEEFDNTTAFLTSERFWHKQVVIKASYFGDYDVLYVSYPGLPPSPPLPPSSITIIDGGPYSGGGNNGRTIKPLGVDIPKRQHKGGLSKGIIAIIALSIFLAVVLCSAAAWALFKCKDHVSQPTSTPRVLPPSLTKAPGTAGPLVGGGVASASSSFRSSIAAYTGSAKTFSMNDIEKATDNFHASRILGEGGFGRVYSGILEDGTKVGVKVLKREDHHGDREFLAEVEMLSRLHHRNLVKLIGICTEVSFRCLVYELIPNGSVESHLHGVDRESSPLDWSARLKIALGAARGLAYLHEDSSPHVIHRDFKSSNILLEDDFTPKVSDFGLARAATDGENRHISTRVMGTFGYVAPEYAMTGHLLVKSDVYSYGVVLLELLTGRKPVDMSQPPGQENLVAWARPLLTSKEGLEAIIDPSLGADVPFDSAAKVAAIASMCVQPEVSDRPFMGEVVQALKLVCNECDEAKEAGSRSSSQEDLSIVDLNTVSGQLPHNFQGQFSATNYGSGVDIEKGLSASELFSSSARFGRQASGSFRRHSYSGPLRTGRNRQLWQIIRRHSGGSVSEHGIMFKL